MDAERLLECFSDHEHGHCVRNGGVQLRFGAGVTREVGLDLTDLGARRVLVLTDPMLEMKLPPVATVLESLEPCGVEGTLYDRVRVEPTDELFQDAIAFAPQRGSTRSSRSAAGRPSTRRRR